MVFSGKWSKDWWQPVSKLRGCAAGPKHLVSLQWMKNYSFFSKGNVFLKLFFRDCVVHYCVCRTELCNLQFWIKSCWDNLVSAYKSQAGASDGVNMYVSIEVSAIRLIQGCSWESSSHLVLSVPSHSLRQTSSGRVFPTFGCPLWVPRTEILFQVGIFTCSYIREISAE